MTDLKLRPLILVRGFGGVDIGSEQRNPYQGYNEGTVYPGRRGDNYIYEGFLLRALKSEQYPYSDATNVVGYYADKVPAPEDLGGFTPEMVTGTVVIDPATEARVLRSGIAGTMWIYRYYDLTPRALDRYGLGLVRLIRLIQAAAARRGLPFEGVDIIAHSMGGLVVREALRHLHTAEAGSAHEVIHRIVTLGTPHRGIAFQRMPGWLLDRLPAVERASNELAAFDPENVGFRRISEENWFDVRRILTVVGTNYSTYGSSISSLANRLSGMLDDTGIAYNRSDGLVKQSSAQLPGAPRTFVHKCHGGVDSLVTSREAYEIAMRFFHGTHRLKLRLADAKVTRGQDWFGHSEFYFGVSIKPRFVDFSLFQQSPEAENCYGPFATDDLSDDLPVLAEELAKPLAAPGDQSTGWAGQDRLIWEGWIDARAKPESAAGVVFRLDIYLGERDTRGIGFSDNVVFRKQYYVQAFPGEQVEMFVHTGEQFFAGTTPATLDELKRRARPEAAAAVQSARKIGGASDTDQELAFDVKGTGFAATFAITIAEEIAE